MPKVLIIRAKEQGDVTMAQIQSHKIVTELVPLSDVAYPYERFKDFDFTSAQQIIISSSNVLAALSDKQKVQIQTKIILSVTKALDGFTNIIYFERMSKIVQYLQQQQNKAKTIYLRGNHTSLTSAEERILATLNCSHQLCYNITYHDREFAKIAGNLRQGNYDSILFFSKKSSEHFVTLIKLSGLEEHLLNIKLCCISERVAGVFKAIKAADILIAKKPNLTELIKCLDYPLAK
jgi:uroporphyrinogen-III synthase